MKEAPSYLHLSVLTSATLACCLSFTPWSTTQRKPQRRNLPKDLSSWRNTWDIPEYDKYNAMWNELLPLFSKHGLHLWKVTWARQEQPDGLPNPDNYLYLSANRLSRNTSLETVKDFLSRNGLSHAARSTYGGVSDCILRVLTAGGQGHDHLRIMRRLSRSPDALLCNNHILPLIDEIMFEDIVIGVFPRVMYYLGEATQGFYMTSVEDVLYMVLQAFEGIAYLHRNLIAHRDVFMENFLVEWLPESINERSSMTRPRVYIIDFETAVEFPENSLKSERFCSSLPFPNEEVYSRPVPPEAQNGEPYCPFQMDMWQFGKELEENLKTGLPEIDQLWSDLVSPNPEDRPTASEALVRLDEYLRNIPSSVLHFQPESSVDTVVDTEADS